MALATLNPSAVVSATGWTGATVANLSGSDNVRATGGTVNEAILVELQDVPADWQAVSGDVVLKAEAVTSGTATRAKRLRLELLDAGNTVLGTGETGNLSTTESVVSVTVTGRTDGATAANGWRVRATVLEGGGKADAVSVSIDRLWVEATYDNSLPSRTGGAALALPLTGTARGRVLVAGHALAAMVMGLVGKGKVAVAGLGRVTLTLGMSGTGTTASAASPRTGAGLLRMAVALTARAGAKVAGTARAVLGVGGTGRGGVAVAGTATVQPALTLVGAGVNAADPPERSAGCHWKVATPAIARVGVRAIGTTPFA